METCTDSEKTNKQMSKQQKLTLLSIN